MHFGSYFTSLLLHALVVLAIVFWPAPPPLRLDRPMLQISMSLGAPGGDMRPSPVLGHQGGADPARAVNKIAPPEQTDAVAIPKTDALKPQETPRREAAAKPVPPKPEAVPIPDRKAPEPPREQPKEQPEPEKPKQAEKPREQPEPQKQPEKPKETPKTPPKKTPSPEETLKAALADAKKQAGPVNSPSRTRTKGKSSVTGALAELERSARRAAGSGGGGGEGRGPGGGGLYDIYMGQVIMAIRPNWHMAVFSRENLVVDVWIKMSAEGEVLECRVERSSGRPEFDGSAVNAVLRTKVLPPPPTPEQQELIVGFNSQDAL